MANNKDWNPEMVKKMKIIKKSVGVLLLGCKKFKIK
tara:strand:- start:37 stop:144 length:108 start_codon:yes stop_codon:yes gene_type:complete